MSFNTQAFNLYRSKKYFKSLDAVRCLSIVVVIWHHSTPDNLPEIFSRGFLGVDMFFVLSGYLIVTLLLREKAKSKTGISLKGFYIRRILRIFPVYFGLLLALSIIYGFIKPSDPDGETFFSTLPFYLAFLANWSLIQANNLGIYWSLAAEEQFYLVWPVLEKWLHPKVVLSMLAFFIILNQGINFGYFDGFFIAVYGTEEAVNLSILDATFTPICFGVLLAHGLHNKGSFEKIFFLLGYRYSSLMCFFMIAISIAMLSGDISGWQRLIVQVVMCLWLASLVIRDKHVLEPIMILKPIKRLGQISYGMYVYHMFALHIVRTLLEKYHLPMDYYYFVFGLLLTTIIAELSYRWYESWFLSIGRKFRH